MRTYIRLLQFVTAEHTHSLSHHTYTHTLSHTLSHLHSLTLTVTHIHKWTYERVFLSFVTAEQHIRATLSLTHTHSRSQPQSQSQSHILIHTLSHLYSLTLTHRHKWIYKTTFVVGNRGTKWT